MTIGDDVVDLGIGLAENAHRIARGAIARPGRSAGRRPPVRRPSAKTARARKQHLQAVEIAVGQFEHAGRRNQGRGRLEEVRAVDGEQGLALLHLVADLGEQPDDPSLIRGEDLGQHFFVEVDAADRGLLDRKIALADRLDLDEFQLRTPITRCCPPSGPVIRPSAGRSVNPGRLQRRSPQVRPLGKSGTGPQHRCLPRSSRPPRRPPRRA